MSQETKPFSRGYSIALDITFDGDGRVTKVKNRSSSDIVEVVMLDKSLQEVLWSAMLAIYMSVDVPKEYQNCNLGAKLVLCGHEIYDPEEE